MNTPHNGSSWGWCWRKRSCGERRDGDTCRGTSRGYVILRASQAAFSKLPCLWNMFTRVCVLAQFTQRFSNFLMYEYACACFFSIDVSFFSYFSATGPSYPCDGACRRGLGHIRALFGQAWPVPLCCFRWGHFLFSTSPLENTFIVMARVT